MTATAVFIRRPDGHLTARLETTETDLDEIVEALLRLAEALEAAR